MNENLRIDREANRPGSNRKKTYFYKDSYHKIYQFLLKVNFGWSGTNFL